MSFIHFGCWNQYKCDPKNPKLNGVSQVMDKLINDEKSPNFYVVAGDNYYPKKIKNENKKTKFLIKMILNQVFNV